MTIDPSLPSSGSEALSNDPVDQVIRYHLRTKHQFNRYARSLGYLDWANQPDPFRRFAGSPLIPLPLLMPEEEPLSPAYNTLYRPGFVQAQPVTMRTLSRFFEFALALSAWKKAGESEWALRSNPSSGNLHPTEGYLVVPALEGLELAPGLYHYAPREHGLEFRAAWGGDLLATLMKPFPAGSFLLGLSSVHWREAWKYGERAFRYCNHDVGHVIGTARVAAATLGWRMLLLDGVDQNTVARLLGTNRQADFSDVEPEHPDCIAVIWPETDEASQSSLGDRSNGGMVPSYLDADVVTELAGSGWVGKANRLSREHAVHWSAIDEVADAAWKLSAEESRVSVASPGSRDGTGMTDGDGVPAGQIIRQRRSAVSFDGKTSIASSTFFGIMRRLLPRADRALLERPMPWDAWPYDPTIHLMIFVHRVEGLMPGLYMLVRDVRKLPLLQQSLNPELTWTKPEGCSEELPLYWLLEGDARRAAAQVSCHQDIAGDSAFSLGMLAEFDGRLHQAGAWFYPRLFWEAGLVGQVLYLEAEAAGVRGTGIGCFFDDPVHEMVGVQALSFQSLYHFTVGGPVEDRRLMTLPAYHHLKT
ncbi:MAG: SagB/ThcOx family dehydrogenase [Nitrospira sp.]